MIGGIGNGSVSFTTATGLEDDRTRFLLLTLRSRLYREATAVFAKCAACPLLRARRNIQAFEPTSPGPEFLKTFTSRRLFKKLGGKALAFMSFTYEGKEHAHRFNKGNPQTPPMSLSRQNTSDSRASAAGGGEAAAAALGWQGTPGSHSSLFAQLVFLCYAYAKRVEPFKIFFPHR